MRADGPPPVSSTGDPSGWGLDSSARGHQFGEHRDGDPGRPGKPEPRPEPRNGGRSTRLFSASSGRRRPRWATGQEYQGSAQTESFNSAAFRQLFWFFFDLLLDLLGRLLVYLNCVIKQFHLEYSLPASFIAERGTETVMAKRTVNQDARPGT